MIKYVPTSSSYATHISVVQMENTFLSIYPRTFRSAAIHSKYGDALIYTMAQNALHLSGHTSNGCGNVGSSAASDVVVCLDKATETDPYCGAPNEHHKIISNVPSRSVSSASARECDAENMHVKRAIKETENTM